MFMQENRNEWPRKRVSFEASFFFLLFLVTFARQRLLSVPIRESSGVGGQLLLLPLARLDLVSVVDVVIGGTDYMKSIGRKEKKKKKKPTRGRRRNHSTHFSVKCASILSCSSNGTENNTYAT